LDASQLPPLTTPGLDEGWLSTLPALPGHPDPRRQRVEIKPHEIGGAVVVGLHHHRQPLRVLPLVQLPKEPLTKNHQIAHHLRQQIAVIGFTGKAIRHHVAVAFEELHELRHGVDEAQRHVRHKACWLIRVNVHRIIPPRSALHGRIQPCCAEALQKNAAKSTMLTPVHEHSNIYLDRAPEIGLGSRTQLIGRRKPSCLTGRRCEQGRW
jgi:hypothetical protein